LNPHDRIDHKILSLARLPVPTLPRLCRRLSFDLPASDMILFFSNKVNNFFLYYG